eukprot:6408930-Prymnesium_polylepis.1
MLSNGAGSLDYMWTAVLVCVRRTHRSFMGSWSGRASGRACAYGVAGGVLGGLRGSGSGSGRCGSLGEGLPRATRLH